MKVTQGQAVAAFGVLQLMGKRQLNSGIAFRLFMLKKKLGDIVEFQVEQENALAGSLGGKFENGRLILPEENRAEYTEKHRAINETECEIDTERISLPLKEIPITTIEEIEILDPFINFTE